MKLALTKPCRKRSANHSQSRTSVLRPGTALICRALTNTTCSCPSKILNTGFQSTPVLSIATWLQPASLSQSSKANKSAVMVEKVRISFFPALSKQATTVLACTSIPQPHSYPTCITPPSSSWRENRAPERVCSSCSPDQRQHWGVPQRVLGSG